MNTDQNDTSNKDTIELTAPRKDPATADIKTTVDQYVRRIRALPVIGKWLTPRPKVSLIRMSGIIADGDGNREARINYKTYAPLIEKAFDDETVKAVVLQINCPGGSPAQSELIGQEIRRYAEDKNIPVLAFVEDVAASGGYWIACAADEIIACESSIVGSIGVISASFGLQKLIEKHGVERRIHTAGKDKSFMDPFAPEKPSDVKRLKDIQSALHDRFIAWVKHRRGEKLTGSPAELFEGDFWLASQGKALGIIDGTGYMNQALQDRFGDNVRVNTYAPEKGFLSSILGGGVKLNLAKDLLETAENQAFYDRYGL